MKNVKQMISMVTDPVFRQNLVKDNERSVRYYNQDLGFADLKRVFADNPDMGPDDLFRLCDVFFTKDRVHQIIAEERRCGENNPFFGSSFQPVGGEFFGGIVLVSTDRFTAMLLAIDGFEIELAKRRAPGERRTLTFGGRETFLKFYNARDFTLQTWKMAPFEDSDDLSTMAPTYTEGALHTCQTGTVLSFGSDQSFEYTAKAGAHALVLQVQMLHGGLPMTLEFDVDDRKLVGASSPSQEPTRLQMLATAMRIFERKDAIPQLESLLDHPLHYVRWHAMREYLGVDVERAWPHLVRLMESDPQPAVRRAAARTIEQISAETMAVAAE